MMTTTKMILASALLALTTSPAMAQSLRIGPTAQQSPTAVQLIQKAQAAAEAGKTQEAQELMAKASAMLTAQAEAASVHAAAVEAIRSVHEQAQAQAQVELARVQLYESHAAAGADQHPAHPAAQATPEGHLRLRLERSQPQSGMVIVPSTQEPEVATGSPFRGRMVLPPSAQGQDLVLPPSARWLAPSAQGQDPHVAPPSRGLRMQRRADFAPGVQLRTRSSNRHQQGNGMEELMRGIHQELRGIRLELSGIRESLSGGHAQGPYQGSAPGLGGPHSSHVPPIWSVPQAQDAPTGGWHQMGVDGTASPQQNVIYEAIGHDGETIQYRLLSPEGGDLTETIFGRYEDGQLHTLPTDLGTVEVRTAHENATIELMLQDLELLGPEMQTLAFDMQHLEIVLQEQALIELEALVELGFVSEEAPETTPSPRFRIQVTPPAPAAAPVPVIQRVRIIETTLEEDPDVQPEDPFFRLEQPASEPTPAKPVITAAGIFGG